MLPVMRTRLLAVLAATFMVFAAAPEEAEARPRPARSRSKSFQANKTFGLGVMFGAPGGISGKYYLSQDTALDFGFGTYYRYNRYDHAVAFHADFLWHPIVLASPKEFWLPLYLGVGLRYLEHGNDGRYRDDSHTGVRLPFGILLDFNNVPLDIFLEFAIILDAFSSHDNHDYNGGVNASVGIRYYFN